MLVYGSDIYETEYLKFWPVILIIISVLIMIKSKKVNPT
jgi:hypothetical protein